MKFFYYLLITLAVGLLLRAFSFQISRFMESALDSIEYSAALRSQYRIHDSRELSDAVDVPPTSHTPSISHQ